MGRNHHQTWERCSASYPAFQRIKYYKRWHLFLPIWTLSPKMGQSLRHRWRQESDDDNCVLAKAADPRIQLHLKIRFRRRNQERALWSLQIFLQNRQRNKVGRRIHWSHEGCLCALRQGLSISTLMWVPEREGCKTYDRESDFTVWLVYARRI